MAVTIREIMEIEELKRLKAVAGVDGLDRSVSSVGIADYEFAEGIQLDMDNAFEKESIVISSLLFAKDQPEKILAAVKTLYDLGVSGFAYKDVIYKELPDEVKEFADEKAFPIFVFGKNVYFEDIIYKISEAVYKDDRQILSEDVIRQMIDCGLTEYEVEGVSRGISLAFKKYVRGVYITAADESIDMARVCRSFYQIKRLREKALFIQFEGGVFALLTSDHLGEEYFEAVLREVIEETALAGRSLKIYRSDVHEPYRELDFCFRESYFTFWAAEGSGRDFGRFDEIGAYKYVSSLKGNSHAAHVSKKFLEPILEREDLLETALVFTATGCDAVAAGKVMNCHPNTIRYRMGKVRELTGRSGGVEAGGSGAGAVTEFEFLEELSAALKIYKINS